MFGMAMEALGCGMQHRPKAGMYGSIRVYAAVSERRRTRLPSRYTDLSPQRDQTCGTCDDFI